MGKLFRLCVIACAAMLLGSCSKSKQEAPADDRQPLKALVLYYSKTGATRVVAEEIKQRLDADIELIEVEEPYDGTYDETIERCIRERADSVIPVLKPLKANIADYDVVFLGYPIWFGTYARPVMGLVESVDFAGKTVVPFCTFGSGGLEASVADLKAALPAAKVEDGYGVRDIRLTDMPAEVEQWLTRGGYIAGEAVALPEYSEPHDVTDEEKAVFDAACGDYIFPLGSPVAAASRTTGNSTEYMFTAESTRPDGEKHTSTIYVTVGTEAGAKPVFTRVVR